MKNFSMTVLSVFVFYAGAAFAQQVQETGKVWITVGSDALPTMQKTLTSHGWSEKVVSYKSAKGVAITQIENAHLPLLSRAMHEEFKRCGGYIVHASYEDALQALKNTATRYATNSVFATYTIDNGAAVNTVIGDLDATKISDMITTLSTNFINRYYTTTSGRDAALWIHDQWKSYADCRADISIELVNHSGYNQPSVILTISGTATPSEVVVLGAHLDSTVSGSVGSSTPAPGADDDASGIATLSEILRGALSNGYRPAKTVKIMGYAAEEVGLRGSGDIAASFKSAGTDVIGVLQLDMTNYNGSSQDIVMIGDNTNTAQNQFVTDLIDQYLGLNWGYSNCGYGCSDHASWNAEGFPASMPFESLFNDYNPYIHTSNDTLAASGGNANHAVKFAKSRISFGPNSVDIFAIVANIL